MEYTSYAGRGRSYLNLGDYQNAEADYKKVLSKWPGVWNTSAYYSELLIAQKRYDEADTILSLRKKIHPEVDTYFGHALIYAAKGQKEQALDTYKEANPAIYALLGMKDEAFSVGTKYSDDQLLQRYSFYNILITNPFYECLHSDPRWQKILEQHKTLYEENLRKYGTIDL